MMRGSSFTNRDNADYSERIGDTVGNGCQRRVGAVNGNGKSRRTGKRSGYESHHARRVDVEGIFQSRCRKGGGADNEQGDDDEGLPLLRKESKKPGPACMPMVKMNSTSPKLPSSLGMMTPKCPNSRAMKITADTSSDNPLILILPNMKPRATMRNRRNKRN